MFCCSIFFIQSCSYLVFSCHVKFDLLEIKLYVAFESKLQTILQEKLPYETHYASNSIIQTL